MYFETNPPYLKCLGLNKDSRSPSGFGILKSGLGDPYKYHKVDLRYFLEYLANPDPDV